MKVTFWGGVRTVTGSRHMLQVGRQKILLDCGLYQGRRDLSEIRNRQIPFDVESVDSVILSHAHIDHSGNLPTLVKQGYKGPIHATEATVDLCELMLPDSAYFQLKDVEFVNKRKKRRGSRRREPLYTMVDAEHAIKQFERHPYDQRISVCEGVDLTFRDAGHILGSAIVELDLKEPGSHRRLVFTGDLGRPHLPILRDPHGIPPCDVLLIESTYGNRYHLAPESVPEALGKIVRRVHDRGGKVLIPAFAVGRAQEVVSILKRLITDGAIPQLPIYVDSPLTVNATEVFRAHPECYDAETAESLRRDGDPFGFDLVHYIRDVKDSMALNGRSETSIIISASGMCEAGRILHHLRNNIENPANLVLIVGFQADDTLGKRLVDKSERIRIFGEEFERRAEVAVMNGFSAHADRSELLDWAGGGEQLPHKTFVVHGNEDQSEALASGLREEGFGQCFVPELGQEFEL